MDWKETLKDAVAKYTEAIEAAGDDEKAQKAVAEAMAGALPDSVVKVLTDKGFAGAYPDLKKADKEKKALEEKVEKAEKAKKAAEDKLSEALKGTPELAKAQEEFDQKYADLQKEHEEEVEKLKGDVKAAKIDAFMDRVGAEALRLGVPKALLPYKKSDPELRKRIREHEDGTLTVGQAEDPTKPITPKPGTSIEEVIAQEIYEGTDPSLRGKPSDPGPGVGPTTPQGGLSKVVDQMQSDIEKSNASRPNPLRPAATEPAT